MKSKYCKAYKFWKTKIDTIEFEEWSQIYKDECQANHIGFTGKMEVDAFIEMFQRSESQHNLKYANYVGDEYSKTFKGILDSEPYKEFTVQKKECIDHVQKWMGSRLRNLKKQTKGLGGKGKLSGKLINELAIYYGLAIRRNHDSVEKMRNEIFATLDYKLDRRSHESCPPGENSWSA